MELSMEEVTFMVGDSDDQERCVDIVVMLDNVVECEEDFIVTLSLETEKPNFILDGNTTVVTIMDSNCELVAVIANYPHLP